MFERCGCRCGRGCGRGTGSEFATEAGSGRWTDRDRKREWEREIERGGRGKKREIDTDRQRLDFVQFDGDPISLCLPMHLDPLAALLAASPSIVPSLLLPPIPVQPSIAPIPRRHVS
ncbi:unnamed protein product, partial [Scytosiphon promiscuus]